MYKTEEIYTWNKLAEEGAEVRERISDNPNDIANWIDKIEKVSKIPIPKTKIITLSDEYLGWLISDHYTEQRVNMFNDYLLEEIKNDFDLQNLDVFVKTGTYSDKFYFNNPHVTDKNKIANHVLNIFYGCMLVGAGTTPTIAVREFIKPKERTETIYRGLPLRRELRFFVDFDSQKILGYSEYWDKNEMKQLVKRVVPAINTDDISTMLIKNVQYVIDNNVLTGEGSINDLKDFVTWANWYLRLDDVNKYVNYILPYLKELVSSRPLTGQWSIDIMFNDVDEPWLIDMALMNQSALTDVMVEI